LNAPELIPSGHLPTERLVVSTLSHRPVWLDLASHSGRDIASFYSAVCGWEAAEGSKEFGGCFMVLANGEPVAGAMPVPADLSGGWTLYVQVSDVAATLGAWSTAAAS
jgi:predicted enzyme related to lactoylglutathione lyase